MSPFASFAAAAGVLTLTPGPDALLVLRTAVSRGRTGAVAAGLGVCTALAGWGCAAAFGLTALLTAAPMLYLALRWVGACYLGFLGLRLILGRQPRWPGRTAGATGGAATGRARTAPATGLPPPGGAAAEAGRREPGGRGDGCHGRAAEPAGWREAVVRGDGCRGPGAEPARRRPSRAGAARGHGSPGRRQLGGCYLRGVLTNAANPKIGVFYLSLLPQFIPAGAPVLGTGLLLAAIHVAESMTWFAVIAVLAGRLGQSLRRPGVRRWTDRVAGTAFLAFAARLALAG